MGLKTNLFLFFVSIFTASHAQAALTGCGTSNATFVRGVEVVQYPQDFCETGIGIVFADGPLERRCVEAVNTKTNLVVGRKYKMCLFQTSEGKFIINAAEDSRAQ